MYYKVMFFFRVFGIVTGISRHCSLVVELGSIVEKKCIIELSLTNRTHFVCGTRRIRIRLQARVPTKRRRNVQQSSRKENASCHRKVRIVTIALISSAEICLANGPSSERHLTLDRRNIYLFIFLFLL